MSEAQRAAQKVSADPSGRPHTAFPPGAHVRESPGMHPMVVQYPPGDSTPPRQIELALHS